MSEFSSNPQHLPINAALLDEAVHSDDRTFVDRLGRTRRTIKGIELSVSDALTARDEAVLARDAAIATAGPLYATIEEGRAAVADGEVFRVIGSGEDSTIVYRRISTSASELLTRTPTTAAVMSAKEAAAESAHPTAEFHTDQVSEKFAAVAFADENGKALLAFEFDGRTHIPQLATFFEFHNDDGIGIETAVVDSTGKVLIGYTANGEAIIQGLKDTSKNLRAYAAGGYVFTFGDKETKTAFVGNLPVVSTFSENPDYAVVVVDKPSINAASVTATGPAMPFLVPYRKNVLHVIIGLGQSLMVGAQSSSTMISTSPEHPELVLMFDCGATSDVRMGLVTIDGGTAPVLNPNNLVGFRPLIAKTGQGGGSRGQTPLESLANGLTADAKKISIDYKSLSFTAALGGTGYSDLSKGTQIYTNMLEALSKAKALAEAQGWEVIVDGCIVKHGESDINNGNYYNNILTWQSDVDADVRAITGQEAPVHFFFSQPSSSTSTSQLSPQAMLDAHNNSPYHHVVGSDYPFGDEYHADLVHFTGPGYFHIGEMYKKAWKDVLWSGRAKSKITQITSAIRIGNVVTLTYEVPVPPLVFDTALITERDVKGFTYSDSSGNVPILNAEIINSGSSGTATIEVTLERIPNGINEAVHYARTPRTGSDKQRGNVRDSDTTVSDYDGKPLYNWGVHQTIKVQLQTGE